MAAQSQEARIEPAQPGPAASSAELVEILRHGLALHQSGKIDAAAAEYGRVLEALPDNPDALHLLGVVSHQKGNSAQAAELIGRAIASHDGNASYHTNFGVVLQKLGRPDEAIVAYRRALALDGDHVDAATNLANLLKDKGEADEAMGLYESAIQREPRVRSAHKHLASIYNDRERYEDAAERFRQFLAVSPDDAEANSNYGYALEHLGQLDRAEFHYRRAHELAPASAEICANLANMLKRLERPDEARSYLLKAAQLSEGNTRIVWQLAVSLLGEKNYAEAMQVLRGLVEREPNHAIFHQYLGTALAHQAKVDEAIRHFQRACELEPGVATHAANLGAAYVQKNQFQEAVAAYRRAVKLDPTSPVTHANFCTALEMAGKVDEANLHSHFSMLMPGWQEGMNSSLAGSFRHTCDFDALASMGDLIATCDGDVEAENLIGVFLNLRPLTEDLDADLRVTALHRKWGDTVTRRARATPLPKATVRNEGKIRLGMLSPDLRSHPVAKFIKPIFDRYDRDRFEIHCYTPFDLPQDPVQADLKSRATAFRFVPDVSGRELAGVIRNDRIDILFDLAGATRNSQLEAMAWRPAPVQVSYLGYGGTTGMETMDYALMDRFVVPTEPGLWTETPLLMNGSWVCFTEYPDEPIAPEPPLKRNGIVTFGTMNAPYKFTASTVALWARVMNAVPGSRMLFVRPEINSVMLQTNIAKEFAKHGIAAERLFFAANAPGQFQHLPYYDEFDIALDTYPAVGGTTTCDTVWMGVPVVSCHGPNMHQRLSHAWVNHCGFPELSVATADLYVATAVALANDPERLADLRRSLRPALKASPLCDAAGFIEDFQDRMMDLVKRHGLRA